MHHFYKLLLGLGLLLSLLGFNDYSASAAPAAENKSTAYSLQPHQGRYFKWAAPSGWRFSETRAGVTLISPDGRYVASLAILLRSRGTRTPRTFLSWIFKNVPAYRNSRILAIKNLPSQRMSNQVWQFIRATVAFNDNGMPVTGLYKVGVSNNYGMNDAIIVGFRAANAEFQQARAFMPQIARSIVLIKETNFSKETGFFILAGK